MTKATFTVAEFETAKATLGGRPALLTDRQVAILREAHPGLGEIAEAARTKALTPAPPVPRASRLDTIKQTIWRWRFRS